MEVESAVSSADAAFASGPDEELSRVNDWSEEVEEEERLEQRAGSITPGNVILKLFAGVVGACLANVLTKIQ